jgi:pimeloyl-ACP methyl ester carboxylesterase
MTGGAEFAAGRWVMPALPMALLLAGACACAPKSAPVATQQAQRAPPIMLELTDAARNRRIPIALYGSIAGKRPDLAIISHGLGSRNTAYAFLAWALVRRGFVVASIQHELPGDEPLAQGDNLYKRRFPNWQAGADSIVFVIRALRAQGITDRRKAVLVGHSNGGDMSMLVAREHPELVRAAFSLDNRRMPLPRERHPRICSIRSVDQPADPGVLPTLDEQKRFGVLVTTVTGLKHNAMSDWATDIQKAAVISVLYRCIDTQK